MRAALADSNVWLRYVDTASPQHSLAVNALERLTLATRLIIVPQNLVEFWTVATRPKETNGLGWTTAHAAERLKELRSHYEFWPDNPDLMDYWLALVQERNVHGKRGHDARLAAAVLSHRLDFLVTFNVADFHALPIRSVHPADVEAALH